MTYNKWVGEQLYTRYLQINEHLTEAKSLATTNAWLAGKLGFTTERSMDVFKKYAALDTCNNIAYKAYLTWGAQNDNHK